MEYLEIEGKPYKKESMIYFNLPINGQLNINFQEETIVTVEKEVFQKSSTNLNIVPKLTDSIEVLDSDLNPTGETTTIGELLSIIHSLYVREAKKRDSNPMLP